MCTNGSCFVAGTPVMSAEGLKPIETLHVGELVAARDELTGNTQWQRIENIFITHDREVWNLSFMDAAGQIEVITATPNHPFALAAGGWRNAAELEQGDQIATLDGRVIQLLMSERDPSAATTYNLMVAGDHTYFVGNAGLWVHNQSECCPDAKVATVTLSMVEGMKPREFAQKAEALREIGERGELYRAANPVDRDPAITKAFRQNMIDRIWAQFSSQNKQFAQTLIDRVTKGMSPDHVHELQLGGLDHASNLKFLHRFTNENIGMKQIRPQIRGLPVGTPIRISIEY
jgi:hypothetical protein